MVQLLNPMILRKFLKMIKKKRKLKANHRISSSVINEFLVKWKEVQEFTHFSNITEAIEKINNVLCVDTLLYMRLGIYVLTIFTISMKLIFEFILLSIDSVVLHISDQTQGLWIQHEDTLSLDVKNSHNPGQFDVFIKNVQ